MKVLVTGASGFIGKSVAGEFYKRGYEVLGWDRDESRDIVFVKAIDLMDEQRILEDLEIFKPDIVIHCAGSADVAKSVQNPSIDFHGNVTITHNLLFAIHKAKGLHPRIVFLSSASVYGNPISLPITEDMPINPLSPYAVHKVMCEDLCTFFVNNYNMDIKIARIFSAYGAGLRKQIFWDMFQKFLTTKRLDMFGTGNESRDYIHVEDVVQSILLIATEKTDQTVFNVANGEEVTIRNVTELFADAAGLDLSRVAFNGIVREGDPINWRADISRITELGYRQTKQIREGIIEYVQWAKKL